MGRENVGRFDADNSGALHNRRLGHNSRADGHDLLGFRFGFFRLGRLGFLDGGRFFGDFLGDRNFGLGGSFGNDLGNNLNRRLGNGLGLGLCGSLDNLNRFGDGNLGFLRRFDRLYGSFGDRFGRSLNRYFSGFFRSLFGGRFGLNRGGGLFDRGLLALAALLLGLFVRSVKVHVSGGLNGASAVGDLAEPLYNSRSQTGFDRGHVVLDLDALVTAFLQHNLAGNAEFFG